MSSTTVFISGATGFIAQHTIKLLIQKGYDVIGSVRTETKGEKLQKLFGKKFSYEIVADLEKEGAFEAALKKHPEVTVFLHTASPFTFEIKDPEKDVILPAVNGTKNVLKAIKSTSPQIKKVVVTASIGSMVDVSDPSAKIDETSWLDTTLEKAIQDPQSTYFASKKFAEEAAWDFVANEKPEFTLTTIHPVLVFGPQVDDEEAKGQLNLSNTFITNLLGLKEGDEIPKINTVFVDVRDVAKAHIVAFEKEGAAGQRIILSTDRYSPQAGLDIIHEKVPAYSKDLPRGNPGARDVLDGEINDKKSRDFLGFEYYSLEDSVVATLEQYYRVN